MSLPTAEAQIEFLQNVQRLFNEGEFQATYKFALLLTLAELAVEHGDDTGSETSLPMPVVAEKFAELYWRQVAPYQFGLPDTPSPSPGPSTTAAAKSPAPSTRPSPRSTARKITEWRTRCFRNDSVPRGFDERRHDYRRKNHS